MDTVNKVFFSLQPYMSQTFITKAESLVSTCTKSVHPSFTRHRLSFKILMTIDENFHQKLFPEMQVKGYTETDSQLLLLPANQRHFT